MDGTRHFQELFPDRGQGGQDRLRREAEGVEVLGDGGHRVVAVSGLGDSVTERRGDDSGGRTVTCSLYRVTAGDSCDGLRDGRSMAVFPLSKLPE